MAGWVWWEAMTAGDFAALDPATAVALLPLAAVEQHGRHLPLGTDAIIADGLLDAALAAAALAGPVLRLPTERIGCSPEHESFPGTLSLPAELLLQRWTAIGAAVARAGVRKLILCNSHGGQTALVDLVAQRLRQQAGLLVVRCTYFRLGTPPGVEDREAAFGWHGGQVETALLLHLAPHLVRAPLLADFANHAEAIAAGCAVLAVEGATGIGWMAEDLNPEGVMGNAAAATAADGAAFLAFYAQRIAKLIAEVQALPWPPADRSAE
jgi:creatinine amidohydrolase